MDGMSGVVGGVGGEMGERRYEGGGKPCTPRTAKSHQVGLGAQMAGTRRNDGYTLSSIQAYGMDVIMAEWSWSRINLKLLVRAAAKRRGAELQGLKRKGDLEHDGHWLEGLLPGTLCSCSQSIFTKSQR
jgi:hypothetical protein